MGNTKIATSIIDFIENIENIYEGNLKDYFKIIILEAQNLKNPYHNLGHMLHVAWVAYQACRYYQTDLSKRQIRNTLIAALFHDFNHSGLFGDDDTNITRAIRALRLHILEGDKPYLKEIECLIKSTEFPHKTPNSELNLSAQILRDADMSQSLSIAWYQQVLIGFSREWQIPLIKTIEKQIEFHSRVEFITEWAKKEYSEELIQEKISEIKRILKILK